MVPPELCSAPCTSTRSSQGALKLANKLPDLKTCLRGEYENRIFQESNVEKIFEVFASVYRNKSTYMNYFDLLRSICPFNYTTKSKEEIMEVAEKLKASSITKLFDLDGSGDISIEEYVFFLTVYYMREFEIKHFFKSEPITQDKFLNFYRTTQSKFNLTLTANNIFDSRQVKVGKENLANEENFAKVLFDGQEYLPIQTILELKSKINYEVAHFKVE
jgi:Ca2+-binding EF-hand superfamily protein